MSRDLVQLAETYQDEALPYPFWMEPKLDGIRAIAVVDDGKVVFQSRYGRKFCNTQYPAAELAGLDDDEGNKIERAVYDGEAFAGNWNLTQSILHTQGPHPDAEKLVYIVFDLMSVEEWEAGISHVAQWDRYRVLKRIIRPDLNLSHLVLVQGTFEALPSEVWDQAREFVKAGFEGGILKDPRAPYRRGRNSAWRKVKFTETLDVPVTGVQPGKGKFVGTLGALMLDLNGVQTKAGTGFSEAERERLWKMWQAGTLVGKTVEVKYQEITKGGKKFRFPVYVRLREDKE